MALVKVIEVLAEGNSVENALENALKEASATVDKIQSIYVKDIQAKVENNAISAYRVNAKVSFLIQK
ncbi:MAG TPA: dodecin family protein [Desulfuromonadales bacterium]|nr:dodecin family protein [Desulfuromonadales bacterium]